MSTHHVIVINGDALGNIVADPQTFVRVITALLQRSGDVSEGIAEVARGTYGVTYASNSMNGMESAVRRAGAYYNRERP